MGQDMSRFLLRFLSLAFAPAIFALPAHAAGPLTIPNSVIQSNAASSGNSFNSLSAEDKRKLLSAPDGDAPANASGGLNLKESSYCSELQQQIVRAQQAAPAAVPDTYPIGQSRNDPNRRYQPASGNVVQYDERSKLEARYHSECNK